MPSASRARRGCITRALWIYALFVLVTVSLAVASGYILAGSRWRAEDAAWTEAGLSMDALGARYPRRPDSPAAVRLDELSRAIGIPSLMDYSTPEYKKWELQKEPFKAWGMYLNELAARPDDRPKPPMPADLQEFLRRHSAAIDAIEQHLLTGGAIEWEQDLSRGPEGPIPYLLGLRRLQEILLLRALDAEDGGHHTAAARSLEAAWVHAASVSERPEILSLLMEIVHAHAQNGVLRRFESAAPAWRDRIATRDSAAHMLRSYQAEAYGWRVTAKQNRGLLDIEASEKTMRQAGIGGRAFRFMTVPYIRLSYAGASAHLRAAMRGIDRQDLCAIDGEEAKEVARKAFPRWNIIGRIMVPDLLPAWGSVRDRALDDELTLRVLEARDQRRSTGTWPVHAVPSKACPSLSWEYKAEPGGRLRIAPRSEPANAKRRVWPFVLSPR